MAETDTRKTAGPKEAAVTIEPDGFATLLQQEFKPRSDRAREAVEGAVATLASQALAQTALISEDAVRTIESIIAEIDRKLTEQINLILHHLEFQQLEGAWRGLHHLVTNTETDEMLKIRVMNISKNELHKTLKKFKGTAWDQSPVFKKLYEEEYGQFGGEPFGCLVGDYHFDHSPPDVELLNEIPRSPRPSTLPLSPRSRPRSCRWKAGRNWPTRAI
jgi:type VI secretion system protein ImpC